MKTWVALLPIPGSSSTVDGLIDIAPGVPLGGALGSGVGVGPMAVTTTVTGTATLWPPPPKTVAVQFSVPFTACAGTSIVMMLPDTEIVGAAVSEAEHAIVAENGPG